VNKPAILLSIIIILLTAGCAIEPDPVNGLSSDGILIYVGNEILNNMEWEIVTNRVQQLRVTGPSGHKIIWSSSDWLAIEISQTGLMRVGPSPNKEVIITATSQRDPSVSAQVTFRTKGLR